VLLLRLDPLTIVPLVQGAPTAWALDGGRIAYVLENGTRFVATLDVDRAAVGPPIQLPGNVTMGPIGAALTMNRDGTLLYVTGGGPPPARKVELVRVGPEQRPTVVPGTTGLEIDNNSIIEVSPDGRSVLLSVSSGQANRAGTHLITVSLESGASTRLTHDDAANIRATWSPDGRRILWISNRRAGHFEAWSRAADGVGDPELLVSEPRDVYEIVLSPDGEWLVYRTDDLADGHGDIYARRLAGDTTVVPIAATAAEETAPEISPDGRWITYSERSGETREIVVRSFPDASRVRVQVSSGGGSEPRWAPDGRALIYRKAGSNQLVFATVTTEGGLRVVSEAKVDLDNGRYLNNYDEHQWDVFPNGRDLLLARLVGEDAAPATPLRLIFEERTIPAVGPRP